MSKNIAIGGSGNVEKTIDMGASNTADAIQGSFFKKNITADLTLNIDNLIEGKYVTVIVRNTAAVTRFVTLPSITNSVDVVSAVPAGKFGVFKVIRAYGVLYALSPVRTEAYFA